MLQLRSELHDMQCWGVRLCQVWINTWCMWRHMFGEFCGQQLLVHSSLAFDKPASMYMSCESARNGSHALLAFCMHMREHLQEQYGKNPATPRCPKCLFLTSLLKISGTPKWCMIFSIWYIYIAYYTEPPKKIPTQGGARAMGFQTGFNKSSRQSFF